MACRGCSKRAKRLFWRMKLSLVQVGPNRRTAWVYETDDVAVAVPHLRASHSPTKATILLLVARLLYGRSRAKDPAPITEVWRLNTPPADFLKGFAQPGMTVRGIGGGESSAFEVRRSHWMRLLGPISERLVLDETPTGTHQAAL